MRVARSATPGTAPARAREWRRVVAAAVVVGVASACTPSIRREAPAGAPVVDVGMDEYAFSMDGGDLRAGRVVFRARNLGRLDHEFVLTELPADLPPLAEQLQSDKRRPVSNVARVALRRPGTTGTFAADLAPGRYGVMCFVRDPDGNTHAVKGMALEFRVG